MIIKTLFWLALTTYHEARGESDPGQKAVVKVIL
ncbi:MAG: cell wall hydrolase, partial [Desulfocapsa sp.]|nr:cell wall hydrolase [Desulfocapsa sp.]